MKRFFLLFALCTTSSLFGFDVGLGFGWNSIDENFKSNLSTNEDKSGKDEYVTQQNHLVPLVTIGQQCFFYNDWVVNFSAEWKYLNYRTPNVSSSRGQILPNATFSSINFFGSEVRRDFTSITRLNNEVILLASLEKELCNGFVYLGLGPALINGSNTVYVSSVHTPNGVGDHLVSTSVKDSKIIWGGAARVGYQYFLNSHCFLSIGYTYLQTGSCQFKNSVNAAQLNGFNAPGPITLTLKRSIKFTVQEFTLSMNLLF